MILSAIFWQVRLLTHFAFVYSEGEATEIINATNQQRLAAGLPLLTLNNKLTTVAELKAADMVKNDYFNHVSPYNVPMSYWYSEAGYDYRYAGENLAVDFTDDRNIITAWMESPKHRENLLNPDYTEVGVAVLRGIYNGHMTNFVVQELGKPQP